MEAEAYDLLWLVVQASPDWDASPQRLGTLRLITALLPCVFRVELVEPASLMAGWRMEDGEQKRRRVT
ncbi:hypothetical protein EYF80_033892 [Liparis tanakae]|uniref:Uncharacterized protein n=1 Tax=Liparis tanakae TaxID=230148 RepID=A0A4Z2GSX8_9TELE|nr:hypothetical protein EYF80_033892 [Liparis tanakae]